jgi:hypothetical protein
VVFPLSKTNLRVLVVFSSLKNQPTSFGGFILSQKPALRVLVVFSSLKNQPSSFGGFSLSQKPAFEFYGFPLSKPDSIVHIFLSF